MAILHHFYGPDFGNSPNVHFAAGPDSKSKEVEPHILTESPVHGAWDLRHLTGSADGRTVRCRQAALVISGAHVRGQ